jgi:hypothetical protein
VCGGSCVPGMARCTNNLLETCDANGMYVGVACPFVCQDSMCAGICAPGALRCTGTNGRDNQYCRDDGMAWVPISSCSYPCYMGICGTCNPGTKQCGMGNMAQLCDANGNWQNTGTCAKGCTNGTCNP